MAEADIPTLMATRPLGALERRIGTVRLVEIDNCALVSMAGRAEAREALSTRCVATLGTALPRVGQWCTAADGLCLLGLQSDQTWCRFRRTDEVPTTELAKRLGHDHGVFLTDQSDGWATLLLEGSDALAVLERLCPLDLHPTVFEVTAVARTSMEHLGVILLRSGDEGFELMTPVSSAGFLVHAIENTATHVANERTLTPA